MISDSIDFPSGIPLHLARVELGRWEIGLYPATKLRTVGARHVVPLQGNRIDVNWLSLSDYIPNAACAAAKRATGTRKGEQLT
jgi:hypothetical protein